MFPLTRVPFWFRFFESQPYLNTSNGFANSKNPPLEFHLHLFREPFFGLPEHFQGRPPKRGTGDTKPPRARWGARAISGGNCSWFTAFGTCAWRGPATTEASRKKGLVNYSQTNISPKNQSPFLMGSVMARVGNIVLKPASQKIEKESPRKEPE